MFQLFNILREKILGELFLYEDLRNAFALFLLKNTVKGDSELSHIFFHLRRKKEEQKVPYRQLKGILYHIFSLLLRIISKSQGTVHVTITTIT